MMEIDASFGYGQVLRTAIAISALTLEPVRITNIRKGRPKPGLAAQHLTGVKVAGEFCNAEVNGLEIGSMDLEFVPKVHNFSDKKIDVGTAGQLSLILQSLTPLLLFANRDVTLEMTGGTSGLGAPNIDFLKHVTFPILSKFGAKIPDIEIIRHGFYPRGQGNVKAKFYPAAKLNPVELTERGSVKYVKGISVAGSLPKTVAERQAGSARKILNENGIHDVSIDSVVDRTASPGTCITLWAECGNIILGADNIGEKGKPAERVGEECARDLVNSIKSNAAVDKWMSDQIIVFMALAEGKSTVRLEEITDHVKSNIMITEKMLSVKFEIDEKSKTVSVDGIGYRTGQPVL